MAKVERFHVVDVPGAGGAKSRKVARREGWPVRQPAPIDPAVLRGVSEPEVTFRHRGGAMVAAYIDDLGPVVAQVNRPVVADTVDERVYDQTGDTVRTVARRVMRRQTVADYLRRAGDITEQQHAACRWFAGVVEEIQAAGSVRAIDFEGIGGGTFDPTTFFRLYDVETAFGARVVARRVLEGLGGPDSLPSRLLWACVGLGLGVRQWMDHAALGREKTKHQQHITGVLRAAIEVMTAHAPHAVDKVESQ